MPCPRSERARWRRRRCSAGPASAFGRKPGKKRSSERCRGSSSAGSPGPSRRGDVTPAVEDRPSHDGGRRLVADERHRDDMAAEEEEEPFVLGAKRQAETRSEHGDGGVGAEGQRRCGRHRRTPRYDGVADGRRLGGVEAGRRRSRAGRFASPGRESDSRPAASWKAASRGRHAPSTRSTNGTSARRLIAAVLSSAKGLTPAHDHALLPALRAHRDHQERAPRHAVERQAGDRFAVVERGRHDRAQPVAAATRPSSRATAPAEISVRR